MRGLFTKRLARTLQLNQESFIAIDNNGKAITLEPGDIISTGTPSDTALI
ncbi:MAG: hypothetical protein ACRD8Z_13840 [Nitrososphaeraceae archaeon]